MKQVVDLEGQPEFNSLDVQVLSIAIDPIPDLLKAVQEWRVRVPHLSDGGALVSKRYGVLQWAMPNGEPGHTFVLVGRDGKVKWIKDYGAPANGGRMYVPVQELYRELVKYLPPRQSTSLSTVERGSLLYQANCLTCHGGATGGSMMDIPPSHNANGHTWHHPDCQLIDIVLHGSGEMGEMMRQMMVVPPDIPPMPAWEGILSQEDASAILAYIKTWWTEEQRQYQGEVTRLSCLESLTNPLS